MKTDIFGPQGAAHLSAPTGYDRFFRNSVAVSRFLSKSSSTVVMPQTVELPTDRPFIFAANHTSLFDLAASLICLGHFGLTARIGVNARFFRSAVGRQLFERLGCVPFSSDTREMAEDAMVEALTDGQVCAIMPEGRLIKEGEKVDGVGPGRPGISRIVRRSGAAVIPVGFTGAATTWPPGSPVVRFGFRRPPIIAKFGTPLYFETDDHVENASQVMAAISGCLVPELPKG